MHTGRSTLNWSVLAAMLLSGCQPESATSPAVAEAGTNTAALTSTIIPLGALTTGTCTSTESGASDVNSSGMIVGSVSCGGPTLPVWWDPALVAHLFPGSIAGQPAGAIAVNANGIAVGTNGPQALRWDTPTLYKVLPTLGGRWATAVDINDAGNIVGIAETASGATHGFYYSPKLRGIVDLGTLPGGINSIARAIAPDGTIVGESEFGPSAWTHAVSWDANLQIHDLGLLPGHPTSGATAINANDDIVGVSHLGVVAFRLVHGTTSMIPLPGPGGAEGTYASGINDVGAIVGTANFSTGTFGALILPGGTGWKNLGTLPGYTGSNAAAVDQTCSRIVGLAYTIPSGLSQAVVWRGWKC